MIDDSSDGEVEARRLKIFGSSNAIIGGVCGGETRCSRWAGDMVGGDIEEIIEVEKS
jgi:hypothetical protein